jgi:hypothetical protein
MKRYLSKVTVSLDGAFSSGIRFIKIADRVEVSVNLKGERISGPPLALRQ